MRRIAFCVLLLGAFVRADGAGLTPEASVGLRVVVDAAISPDGEQVAYRLEQEQAGELWIVDVAGGTPSQLSDSGVSPGMARWSADGGKLAWLARPSPDSPRQIYMRSRTRAGWGEVAPLPQASAGVSSFQWSPDGSRIAYLAADGESEERARARESGRDWIVFDDPGPRSRLYVIDVATRTSSLVTRAELMVWSFAWSPSGDRFVIGASPGTTDDDRCLHVRPYVVAVGGGVPRLVAETQGMLGQVGWSMDGREITWLGSTDVTDPRAGSLFMTVAEGGSAPRNLTTGYEGTVISMARVPGRDAELAFLAEEGAHTAMHVLDTASLRMRRVGRSREILWGSPTFARDGKTFAVIASAPGHPEEVFAGRLDGKGGLRRLTNSNPQLAGVALGAQEVTRWRSRDGSTIEGVLIKPVGHVPGSRYPTVIHVHGGSELAAQNGWNAFGIQESTNLGQLLAGRGYAVLYPNYRGSSGRGVEFLRGNRRDVMGREWEDIESGLDHLVDLGVADGARAGIYGFSWGGYAAGWGATWASHRFKAAVAGAGIYDWISEAGTSNTRLHEQRAHWDAPLYEHFPLYLERSPIFHMRKASTPVLLLHGERDPSCPVTQAIEFHTALKWAGVPVELVIYPRQGHYITERAHQLDYMERSLAWFDRYLK
jgi:dipeptidyl aminopeptidase/acylaminoacyl peptidase